jgi:hypothetical protein
MSEIKEELQKGDRKRKKIKENIKTITEIIAKMKNEIQYLPNEADNLKWEKKINELEKTFKNYKKELKVEINSEIKIEDNNNNDEYMINIDNKIDNRDLTTHQAIKRGDNYLNDIDKMIDNMIKIINESRKELKDIDRNLGDQITKIGEIEDGLKEIDISIKRASNDIKTIFKQFFHDKLVKCLIIIIFICIFSILIIANIGKNKRKNENLAKDTFNQGKRRLNFLWEQQ